MTESQNTTKEKNTQLYPIHIPKYIQNEWKRLFTKQLYGIGKDILRKDDNLLLRYGFTRQRPPKPDMGSNQYSLTDKHDQIILWGFGMVFATKNNGLFLWRHEFEPKLFNVNSLLPNLWNSDQLPQCTIPKTKEETLLMLRLLVKSINWLESYEKWVIARCGQTYRNESLQGYSSTTSHIHLDEKWSELSKKFTKYAQLDSKSESNSDAVESETISSNFKPTSQNVKKTCGPCGETYYSSDGDFCPSCGWEGYPC